MCVYVCVSLVFFLHPLRIEDQEIRTKNASILTTVTSMSQKRIFVCDPGVSQILLASMRLCQVYCCWVASVVSDSVRPHRRQPTRLRRPWDSPGKDTGVGCHFLLQCMKVKSEVSQSCPTLRNPMDWSLPGSSIHGIFQATVLECGAIAFSRHLITRPRKTKT